MSEESKIIERIAAVVGQPSISSADPAWDHSNATTIALIANWCESAGFSVSTAEVAPDKFNLIATLGSLEQDDGLVLAGHTDTVPFDARAWHTDPLRLSEVDGRLFGLGVADMKAFFAIALAASQRFRPADLAKPLRIVATADEESSMNGARRLRDVGQRLGRFAVIGEPTGLRPIRMHKGVMMEQLELRGRAGHSSNPALGVNAIDALREVLDELVQLREEWKNSHRHSGFEVDHPTLNFGAVAGGDNPNRICPSCRLSFDIRVLPGMSIPNIRETLRDRIAKRIAHNPELSVELKPLFEGVSAFETPASAWLVQQLQTMSECAAGSVAFGTEAPFFQELGAETVILGPGHIAQAHQANEYLALSELKPAIDFYEELIRKVCVFPETH